MRQIILFVHLVCTLLLHCVILQQENPHSYSANDQLVKFVINDHMSKIKKIKYTLSLIFIKLMIIFNQFYMNIKMIKMLPLDYHLLKKIQASVGQMKGCVKIYKNIFKTTWCSILESNNKSGCNNIVSDKNCP